MASGQERAGAGLAALERGRCVAIAPESRGSFPMGRALPRGCAADAPLPSGTIFSGSFCPGKTDFSALPYFPRETLQEPQDIGARKGLLLGPRFPPRVSVERIAKQNL